MPDPKSKKRLPLWRLILRLLLILLLIPVVVAWFVLTFQQHWLAEQLLDRLRTAMDEQGMYADHESVEVSLTRGSILKGVSLYRDPDHTTRLLRIEDTAIAPAYGQALGTHGISGLLTLRKSKLELFARNGPITLDNITGAVLVNASGANLAMLEFKLGDLRVQATGDIIWAMPEKEESTAVPAQPDTAPGEEAQRIDLSTLDLSPIQDALQWLDITAGGALPDLTMQLNKPSGDQPLQIDGHLTGLDLRWRGLPVDSLLARFSCIIDEEKTTVDISELKLVYQGRNLYARLHYDTSTQKLTVHSLQSEIDFISFAGGISPAAAKAFSTLTLSQPPQLTADGYLQLNDMAASQLNLSVNDGGIVLDINNKPLALTSINTELTMNGGALTADSFSADVFGSQTVATFAARPFDSPFSFTTNLQLNNADLQLVSNFAGMEKPMQGALDFTFEGGGSTEIKSITAQGRLTAGKNEFSKIPLFGLLTSMFSVLNPGFSGGDDSNISMDYQLANGILTTENLVIHAGPVKISSVSKVNLVDQLLDIKASAATEGVSQLVTGIIGKLLEIEVGGTFKEPKWQFNNMPFMSSPGDVSGLKNQLESAEQAEAAAEAVAEAEKEEEKADFLKKTGRSIGKLFGGGKDEQKTESDSEAPEQNQTDSD